MDGMEGTQQNLAQQNSQKEKKQKKQKDRGLNKLLNSLAQFFGKSLSEIKEEDLEKQKKVFTEIREVLGESYRQERGLIKEVKNLKKEVK